MITINAEKRDIFGKKLSLSREKGKLPAVLYGPKEKTFSLFINLHDFKKVWQEAGETSVISLKLDNTDKEVLIHKVDFDPIKDSPIHVDFYAIERGKVINVNVPIEFVGVAPAVKELSGTLLKVLHEIEIEAMPKDIPHDLTVDISGLVDFESHITIKDIVLPSGVVATASPDETVALVSPPKEEEEEEEEVTGIEDIEVEKKGKAEEEGETKEKEGDGGGEKKESKE